MKILYHHRTMAEDAQGIHIAEMVRAFREEGHEVRVVSLVKEGGKEQEGSVSLLGQVKERIPAALYELTEIGYTVYGALALLAEVRRFRPDFIYERYALYNASGVIVSRLTGVPLILEVNAPLAIEKKEHGGLCFPRVARWFERAICSASHRTLAVSTPLKKILVEEGVPAGKIALMPNGVRREALYAAPDGAAVRERLGISLDAVVLGFVGWFRPWHGLDRLIELFDGENLAERGISLLLVGDGPIYRELVDMARARGLLDRSVFFTGPLPHGEVHDHIGAFDIALQPSVTSYASPMKVFEYLSMGKPVIAPDLENIREILTDGYDAWIFPAAEAYGMADAMLRAVADRDEVQRRGRNARQTIVDRDYLWQANARRTAALLGPEA